MNDHAMSWTGHLCFVCEKNTLTIPRRGSGSGGSYADMECSSCKSTGKLTNMPPWRGYELPEIELRGLFYMAGISIIGKPRPILNGYWNEPNAYPWWFVKTARGYIELGWRKRVIEINWSDTDVRGVVTADEVTKDDIGVHAYSMAKAVEYMTELGRLFAAKKDEVSSAKA